MLDFSLLKTEWARVIQLVKLDRGTMKALARDREATRWGAGFILLATFSGAVGSMLFPMHYKGVSYRPTLIDALLNGLQSFLLIVAILALIHFLAQRIFQGKGSFESFFRPAAYAYGMGVLNFFVFLTPVVLVWIFVMMGKVLVEVKGLTVQQAVFTLLLSVGVVGGLLFLSMGVNPGNLYGGLYVAPY